MINLYLTCNIDVYEYMALIQHVKKKSLRWMLTRMI